MNMLNRLYGWYGKRVVRGVIVALILLLGVAFFIKGGKDETGEKESTATPERVDVMAVRDLGVTGSFAVVGTVRAVSEAKLQTEAGGRITSVSYGIGDFVPAGTVLATLENSRERAALLQAEGAYESAVASSKGGEANLDEAKVGVRNAHRETFTQADTVVRTVIDQYFSNPDSPISGLKLSGTGNAQEFLAIRKDIGDDLRVWSEDVSNSATSVSEEKLLREAEEALTMISDLAARIALILADEDKNIYLSDSEREAKQVEIAGARSTLDRALATISGARRSYEQARIGGGETDSQSSALLKSALGNLRSAQASYEKTLVRTPISGIVNALYLRTGEYAQMGQPAAVVANNGSLEIATALGEEDVSSIEIGDTVTIGTIGTGTITRIAPAVDPLSGKSEVLIGLRDTDTLKNGSTVTVTFSRNNDDGNSSTLIIPLSALKFLPDGPVAFGVKDDGTLVAIPVVVGAVMGNGVEVNEGLTADSLIVTDARGLKEGESVSISNE